MRECGRITADVRWVIARCRPSSRPPKSPKLGSVVSEQFEVVDWQEYPGMPAAGKSKLARHLTDDSANPFTFSDILTPLSKHLYESNVPMYIPPLVLSPDLPPPPASTNPFYDLSDLERTPSPS